MPLLPPVDHLVWAGRDLEREIDRLETLTGVRAAVGGRHPGEGTRNALIGIGPSMYLELIAPDPDQEPPPHPRWFGLDILDAPRLMTWAARCDHIDGMAARARAAGIGLGAVRQGRRELSGGEVISWRLTYPDPRLGSGVIPFFIDWGDSRHPSRSAPGGIGLVDLRAEHPDPAGVSSLLGRLGLELRIAHGPAPALIATLDTPRGLVELR